jgi:hypothetical protein
MAIQRRKKIQESNVTKMFWVLVEKKSLIECKCDKSSKLWVLTENDDLIELDAETAEDEARLFISVEDAEQFVADNDLQLEVIVKPVTIENVPEEAPSSDDMPSDLSDDEDFVESKKLKRRKTVQESRNDERIKRFKQFKESREAKIKADAKKASKSNKR